MANYQYKITARQQNGRSLYWELLPTDESNAIKKFLPGQHILLALTDDNNQSIGPRPFTITSAPSELPKICLGIKIYQNFTKTAEAQPLGRVVTLSDPIGEMVLDETAAEIVMLAGGSGVTPFISMIKEAATKNLPTKFVLIYSSKNENEIMYREFLDTFAADQRVFKLINTLTDEIPAGWRGETGRVNREMILKYCAPVDSKKFYICGPGPFNTALHDILIELGVAETMIISGYRS